VDQSLTERRAYSRFGSPSLADFRAVLRPGRSVWLVNLSCGGALIEGRLPLRPGSRVYLQLSTEEHSVGRSAQVLRCLVASLAGSDGVRYRGALKFDDDWQEVWEEFTHNEYEVPVHGVSREAVRGHVLPIQGQRSRGEKPGGW
jgi:hypothetical protein